MVGFWNPADWKNKQTVKQFILDMLDISMMNVSEAFFFSTEIWHSMGTRNSALSTKCCYINLYD